MSRTAAQRIASRLRPWIASGDHPADVVEALFLLVRETLNHTPRKERAAAWGRAVRRVSEVSPNNRS